MTGSGWMGVYIYHARPATFVQWGGVLPLLMMPTDRWLGRLADGWLGVDNGREDEISRSSMADF